MSHHSPARKTTRLPSPALVTSSAQLTAMLKAICDEPYTAVDTASNSLHAYQERVCLIQISIPNADYIVIRWQDWICRRWRSSSQIPRCRRSFTRLSTM